MDSLPRFTLPSLAKGDIVNIRLDFPDLIASANPKTFEMKILSSSGSDIYSQPLPMGTTVAIDQSTKSYQTFWTVPTAGTYILQITSTDPAASEALHWYYLTVWKAKDGTSVVKAVDMLRSVDFLYRYLRAEPTASANTLTISHTGGSDKSSLFSTDSASQFSLSALETANAFENTNTYTVSTGYYLAKYSITLGTSADLGYETKTYDCPYHSDYTDLRGIFKPCSAATPSNTFTIPAANDKIFGDHLLQVANKDDALPIYDLGSRTSGEKITLTLDFQRFIQLIPPNSLKLTLLDADNSNQPVSSQPAPFGTAITINPFRKTSETLTWNVLANGNFRMQVERVESGDPKGMVIYDLSIDLGATNLLK